MLLDTINQNGNLFENETAYNNEQHNINAIHFSYIYLNYTFQQQRFVIAMS